MSCRPEVLSVAPMLECTDRHWRYFLRGITRHTTLYTEMYVDTTLINQEPNLEYFIGHDCEHADPTVIQLGGHDAEDMKAAVELVNRIGGYSEINLNCGCPSPRVYKRCFGARLMLEPDHVRELVHAMSRVAAVPVTVKCRIGADDLDSYEDLQRFIETVHSGGVQKFIIHSRKCLLSGLTPKQNRDIPPLKYDVVHRLVSEYPDLKFVLNGGINTFAEVDAHIFGSYEGLPAVHGVMIGRAVYNDPYLLATADSTYFNHPDPCLTRRENMERYLDYCDFNQSDEGPRKTHRGKISTISPAVLLKTVHNAFVGCAGNSKYRIALNDLYVHRSRAAHPVYVREVIEEAMKEIPDELLDAPIGNLEVDGGRLSI